MLNSLVFANKGGCCGGCAHTRGLPKENGTNAICNSSAFRPQMLLPHSHSSATLMKDGNYPSSTGDQHRPGPYLLLMQATDLLKATEAQVGAKPLKWSWVRLDLKRGRLVLLVLHTSINMCSFGRTELGFRAPPACSGLAQHWAPLLAARRSSEPPQASWSTSFNLALDNKQLQVAHTVY